MRPIETVEVTEKESVCVSCNYSLWQTEIQANTLQRERIVSVCEWVTGLFEVGLELNEE